MTPTDTFFDTVPPFVRDVLKYEAVEITLPSPEDFLKVKETLTRMGIMSRRNKTLYQSCHILHKSRNGVSRYWIIHFKSLFKLDGHVNQTEFTDEDRMRTNTIAKMLEEWGLVKVVPPVNATSGPFCEPGAIGVLSFKEKASWKLVEKYSVGTGRRKQD